MTVICRRCAGLDVHRDKIAVCVRIRINGKYEEHHEVFGTFTAELKRLAQWLKAFKVGVSRWNPPECTGYRSGTY